MNLLTLLLAFSASFLFVSAIQDDGYGDEPPPPPPPECEDAPQPEDPNCQSFEPVFNANGDCVEDWTCIEVEVMPVEPSGYGGQAEKDATVPPPPPPPTGATQGYGAQDPPSPPPPEITDAPQVDPTESTPPEPTTTEAFAETEAPTEAPTDAPTEDPVPETTTELAPETTAAPVETTSEIGQFGGSDVPLTGEPTEAPEETTPLAPVEPQDNGGYRRRFRGAAARKLSAKSRKQSRRNPFHLKPLPKPGRDANQKCCWWAIKGECDSNPFWMRPYCQKSCGTKGCTLETADECKVRVNLRGCPWSKNNNKAKKTKFRKPLRSSIKRSKTKCQDKETLCRYWASVGQCRSKNKENKQFMHRSCPKSCKRC